MRAFWSVGVLFGLVVSVAQAAPEKSVITLDGAPKQCFASFFHFTPDSDLALVPTSCLDNLITGGVSANGQRSLKVVVHPEVEKNRILDPSLVPGTFGLAVVVFPHGTTPTVTPLAPAPPKIQAEELSAYRSMANDELPSISETPAVALDEVEWASGQPVHDALGRVSGVITHCDEKSSAPACQISSLHDAQAFELLWHARRKLGAKTAGYRIPTLDVERAELCWFTRRRCAPATRCAPVCPPRPVYVQQRPVYVYPSAPVPVPASSASAYSQVQQQMAAMQSNAQRVDNRQNFNVSPNNSSRSNSNPRIENNPTNTNNANNSNSPTFTFNPTIVIPQATASGGSSVYQGPTNSAPAPAPTPSIPVSTPAPAPSADAISEMRAAEDRLYQERAALAQRQAEAVAALERDKRRASQMEQELEDTRRSVQRAEQMKAELEEADRKARAQAEELKKKVEAAAEEARKAELEAARLREVSIKTIRAALLKQDPIDPTSITGEDLIARLVPAPPVDHTRAFDRSVPERTGVSTLSSLVASNGQQLQNGSSRYNERAFFASLNDELRSRDKWVTEGGVSEGQLAMLVENYRYEHMTYAQYALAGMKSQPWWTEAGDAEVAGIRSAADLDRTQFLRSQKNGIPPEFSLASK